MFIVQFHNRFYKWFCLAVVAFSIALCSHPARGQSDQPATTPAITPVPTELNACFPQNTESPVTYQFGLIAVAATPEGRFHYINVFSTYQERTRVWKTLIKSAPDLSSCQNLIPEETEPVSLTQFMPLEQATQLAKAALEEWKNRDPYDFDIFLKRLQNKPIDRSRIDDAPMDNAPPLGQTTPSKPTTCKLFPEEAEALKELGISHKCQVNS